MSGHSHWAGIKHRKGAADQKRGKVFSKLLSAISAAAKPETNPDFNPRLRTAIQKAREASVPAENIERAIQRATESGGGFKELLFESYGPGGAAILIEAITDNRNRTVAEIKNIINEYDGKWAEGGSVLWAFDRVADERGSDADQRGNWKPKFTQELGEKDKNKLKEFIAALEEYDDVQNIYVNVKI